MLQEYWPAVRLFRAEGQNWAGGEGRIRPRQGSHAPFRPGSPMWTFSSLAGQMDGMDSSTPIVGAGAFLGVRGQLSSSIEETAAPAVTPIGSAADILELLLLHWASGS